ncbi:MAG: fimbrial protein [Pseudomonadota bacterium]
MANPDVNEEPLDPAVENIRRKMVRLLAVSFGIMLLGLFAVLAAIVYKITQSDENNPEQAEMVQVTSQPSKLAGGQYTIGKGSSLVSTTLQGNRLVVTVKKDSGGFEVLVVDTASGAELARYTFSE